MSIDIYPAHVQGDNIYHAASWDEESTMNLANANFYSLARELKLEHLMKAPGHIKTKTLKLTLQTVHSPRYSQRLNELLAQAEELKALYIAFA